MRRTLKKDNHGSTLILVVVAISFISILGTLILSLTMTNIQIKQSDLMAKGNFYESEEAIDEFRAVLANTSSDAIQEAYEHILENYSKYTSMSSTSLKEQFDKRYINNLFEKIASDFETFETGDFSGSIERKQYNFSASKLNGLMKTDKYKHAIINDEVIAQDLTKSIIEVCYKKDAKDNKLTIKGLRIKYTDSKTDYESTIQTDINLLIPDMDFDSTKLMPSFKNYALVADKGLTVTNSGTEPFIYGNLYAGAESVNTGGVNVSSLAHLTIKPLAGENEVTIVNRMDINVENGCSLLIGEDGKKASLWTRNIRTKRGATSEDKANITVYGDLYVEDDTRLDANNSNVAFKGNYTGFSYNKTNSAEVEGKLVMDHRYNSNYSSAIYVNGKKSHLNLKNMDSIHLAGRSFISRSAEAIGIGAQHNDIPMGESITIKSNQIAYLIPSDYMMLGENKISNPVAIPVGGALPSVTFNIPEEVSSLGLNDPVYTVNIHKSGTTMLAYYYYNFKSQKAANDYFELYYMTNRGNLDANSSGYLENKFTDGAGTEIRGDGLELGGASIITGGYALKFEAEGEGFKSSIFAEPSYMNHSLGAFTNVAKEYKALQDTLRNDIGGITKHRYGEDADLVDDKTKDPLIKKILAQTGSLSTIETEAANTERDAASGKNKYGFKKEPNYDYKFVPITLQDGNDGYIYIVNNTTPINLNTVNVMNDVVGASMDEESGIIVFTGDVNVNCNFDGVIICGGKMQIAQTGIELKANPRLVQEIINCAFVAEKDLETNGRVEELNKTKISHYFDAYSTEVEGSNVHIEDVNVMDYITFSNWKKNVE